MLEDSVLRCEKCETRGRLVQGAGQEPPLPRDPPPPLACFLTRFHPNFGSRRSSFRAHRRVGRAGRRPTRILGVTPTVRSRPVLCSSTRGKTRNPRGICFSMQTFSSGTFSRSGGRPRRCSRTDILLLRACFAIALCGHAIRAAAGFVASDGTSSVVNTRHTLPVSARITTMGVNACLPALDFDPSSDISQIPQPLGATEMLRCPCLIRFSAVSATQVDPMTSADRLHFIVVRGAEARRINKITTIQTSSRNPENRTQETLRDAREQLGVMQADERYSHLDIYPTLFDMKEKLYKVETDPVTIDEDDDFLIVVLRTLDPSSPPCEMQARYVFESTPPKCPVIMKPPAKSRVRKPSTRQLRPSRNGIVARRRRRMASRRQGPEETPISLPALDRPAQHDGTEHRLRSLVPLGQQTGVPLKVVGGSPADDVIGQVTVSVTRQGNIMCTGVLVSPQWILSAAHCGIRLTDRVLVGSTDGITGRPYFIQSVTPHPDHDPSVYESPNDIALIKLTKPVSNTEGILVLDSISSPPTNTFLRASGYGMKSEDWPASSSSYGNELSSVDVPVIAMERCRAMFADGVSTNISKALRPTVQLCAGYLDGGCDSCLGDSGGPLTGYDTSGNMVLIGIVSFGIGCARPSTPGVYTLVGAFQNWMRDVGADYVTSKSELYATKRRQGSLPVVAPKTAGFRVFFGSDISEDVAARSNDEAGATPLEKSELASYRIATIILAALFGVLVFAIITTGAIWFALYRKRQSRNNERPSGDAVRDAPHDAALDLQSTNDISSGRVTSGDRGPSKGDENRAVAEGNSWPRATWTYMRRLSFPGGPQRKATHVDENISPNCGNG